MRLAASWNPETIVGNCSAPFNETTPLRETFPPRGAIHSHTCRYLRSRSSSRRRAETPACSRFVTCTTGRLIARGRHSRITGIPSLLASWIVERIVANGNSPNFLKLAGTLQWQDATSSFVSIDQSPLTSFWANVCKQVDADVPASYKLHRQRVYCTDTARFLCVATIRAARANGSKWSWPEPL